MKQIRTIAAILSMCIAGLALGSTPDCEIDLAKALDSQPTAAAIKVSVPHAACVAVDGGSLVVSDARALKIEVIEWKELEGGGREASVVRLIRQKAGTHTVQLQRGGVTKVFVVAD